jgi:uncharacterized protein (DUF2141 family)
MVSLSFSQDNMGTIVIELDTLENQTGSIQISLYDKEQGFPDEYEEAYLYKTIPITSELDKMILENIPFGTYALSILHDENDDFELDTNFLGIPSEGYGFSNNVKGMFGPPDFEDAVFELKEKEIILNIKMNY